MCYVYLYLHTHILACVHIHMYIHKDMYLCVRQVCVEILTDCCRNDTWKPKGFSSQPFHYSRSRASLLEPASSAAPDLRKRVHTFTGTRLTNEYNNNKLMSNSQINNNKLTNTIIYIYIHIYITFTGTRLRLGEARPLLSRTSTQTCLDWREDQ